VLPPPARRLHLPCWPWSECVLFYGVQAGMVGWPCYPRVSTAIGSLCYGVSLRWWLRMWWWWW
jgi:hypothetical protein